MARPRDQGAGGSGHGGGAGRIASQACATCSTAEVVVAPADDLQADRQPGFGLAAVDARGRLLAHVEGDVKAMCSNGRSGSWVGHGSSAA